MADPTTEPILEGVIITGPPPADAPYYELVFVDERTCVARATLPSGETFYGFDVARP